MDQIDVDEILEMTFSDDAAASQVEVKFKDGSRKFYNGTEHPEIFAMLNHWTPPTA